MKRLTQLSRHAASVLLISGLVSLLLAIHFVQHMPVRECTSISQLLVESKRRPRKEERGLSWNLAFCCSFWMNCCISLLSFSLKLPRPRLEGSILKLKGFAWKSVRRRRSEVYSLAQVDLLYKAAKRCINTIHSLHV